MKSDIVSKLKEPFMAQTLCLLMLVMSGTVSANLISNGSFEVVPGNDLGQGLLPTDWVSASNVYPGADTYYNGQVTTDVYGLDTNSWYNFLPGTTAYDGERWVAGGRVGALQESFGQYLGDSLMTGATYTMSGYLLESAYRTQSSGYKIYLTSTNSSSQPAESQYLGTLGLTSDNYDTWTKYSFSFVATDLISSMTFLQFVPYFDVLDTSGYYGAYPGLDMVSLELSAASVDEPGSIYLLLSGVVVLAGIRKRRKNKCL